MIEYEPSELVVRRNEDAPQDSSAPALENEAIPPETSRAEATNTPSEDAPSDENPNVTYEAAQRDEQVVEAHSDPEQAAQSEGELSDSPSPHEIAEWNAEKKAV